MRSRQSRDSLVGSLIEEGQSIPWRSSVIYLSGQWG